LGIYFIVNEVLHQVKGTIKEISISAHDSTQTHVVAKSLHHRSNHKKGH